MAKLNPLKSNDSFNKGEWSEVYTLIKLLKDGKLFAADEQLSRLGSEMHYPIIRIRREETPGEVYDYFTTQENDQIVKIYHNGEFIKALPVEQFDSAAIYMYHTLSTAGNGNIPLSRFGELENLLTSMNVNKVKAGNDEKADIIMEIIDVNTGYRPMAGFSIKSQLGSAPTLLNASAATNFIYKLENMNDVLMDQVNSTEGRSKIISRFDLMAKNGVEMCFCGMNNINFSDNLEMIDSKLPEIMAQILIYRYRDGVIDVKNLTEKITIENPLNYHKNGIYEYKIKKLLCSAALGMLPSKPWDGLDEANGGYIVVKEDGDIVAYYIYNRNAFESYLLKNTKLEAASTTRHNYASVYKDGNDYYMNLNLQIRFK